MCVCVCVYVCVFMSLQVRVREGQRETVFFFFFCSVITNGSKNHISNLFPIFFLPSHCKTVYNQPVIDCTNEIACYNLG